MSFPGETTSARALYIYELSRNNLDVSRYKGVDVLAYSGRIDGIVVFVQGCICMVEQVMQGQFAFTGYARNNSNVGMSHSEAPAAEHSPLHSRPVEY